LVGAAIEVRGAGSGRLRLQVLANSRAKTLEAFTNATTAPGAIVHTDGLNSYAGLAKLGYQHRPRKQTGARPGDELLPRVHRAISYVFRHNRRGTPMAAFQTLLGLGAIHDP
jgi:hypothetical protein